MARTNNLTNFLNDVATAIKTKLGNDTPIPASQFDTKIGEIETGGTYQSKTINVTTNGSQTITPDTGYDALSSVLINVQVPIPSLQTKNYEFTQNTHIVLSPEQGYDGFSSIDLTINVPGSQINNQDKTITQNGSYTADQGYTGLGTVTVNVPSGSGGVKLFDTVEHMQADSTAQEGDLAVVYREEIQHVQEESEFDSCTFPNTVVLDTAFSDNIYGSFRSTGSSRFDGNINMSSSRFRFTGYGESGQIRVQYESQDGITYTRTDGGEELQEFGTSIKYEPYEPWNDVIGKFMKIGVGTFEGLYECGRVPTQLKGNLLSDLTVTDNNVSTNHSITINVSYDELVERILSMATYIKTLYSHDGYSRYPFWCGLKDANTIVLLSSGRGSTPTSVMYLNPIFKYDTGVFVGMETSSGGANNAYEFSFNINTGDYINTTVVPLSLTNPDGNWHWNYTTDFNSYYMLGVIDYNNMSETFTWMDKYVYCLSNTINSNTSNNTPGVIEGLKYNFATTQLTLKNTNELLPNITAYGKNGVVTGDGSIMSHLPVENVWSDVFNISTSINNVPDSNADKYYTTTHLSSYDEGTNKLYGYVLDENGQYTITRYEYGATANRLGSPKVQLGTKLYYVIQNTAEAIIILEFDTTTEETATYTVANSATGSVDVSITENYIVYGYITGSYRAYTYHVRKQHKTTGEQTEAASWAIYNSNNIYLVGGINDKVLVGTDRNQNSYATYMRTVNLATNAVTIVGNTGIPMGLPGMHFTDNRYAYIPTIYKVTGSSLIKDEGYGWFYDFENNVGLWVYPTVKHTVGWYNSGVCPATADYAILGMADDHPEIFIKYTTVTHTLSEVTVNPSTSSSYNYPICVKNDILYFTNCTINVRTNTSTAYNFDFSAQYGYDISIEPTRVRVFHPYKTNKSITYIFPVSATSIDLYNLPDMILAKGKNRSSSIKRRY